MNYKYVIECDTKEEMECISNGLETYKLWLNNELINETLSDYLKAEYKKSITNSRRNE